MAFMDDFEHLKIQLKHIKLATNDFGDKPIGEGGFGKVFKGELSLPEGKKTVALKRLDRKHGQGNTEFWKEIMMLSQYKQKNLISLLGFCNEDGERILVYASKGSLADYLGKTTLTWKQLLNICLEVACGLKYLHDPVNHQRVLHRDVKSANILLDENFTAKISDFGLSKIGPADQHYTYTYLVSYAVGTPGYCDPAYMNHGFLTKETDVYSFGVVLFEVVCGRSCFEICDSKLKILVPNWKKRYEEGKLEEIICKNLKEEMDMDSCKTFLNIAYQCLHIDSKERPTMADIVKELEIAIEHQEDVNERAKYEERISIAGWATTPVSYRSGTELKLVLSKGILLKGNKARLLLNKSEEYHEMRFFRRYTPSDFHEYCPDPHHVALCVAQKRGDDLLSTTLYQFTSSNKTHDFKFDFLGLLHPIRDHGTREPRHPDLHDRRSMLQVIGIEFLPVDYVNNEKLKKVPPINLDKEWEKMLPRYAEIIKLSKVTLLWKTKRELYHLFHKGFLIQHPCPRDTEVWFSVSKHLKKRFMLPATTVLQKDLGLWDVWRGIRKWNRISLPESRFGAVVEFCETKSFRISCYLDNSFCSPKTYYACYLVYKLPESHSLQHGSLVRIFDEVNYIPASYRPRESRSEVQEYFVDLLASTHVPFIECNGDNSPKALKTRRIKGHPKLRKDGWMEIQIWDFRSADVKRAWDFVEMKCDVRCHGKWKFTGLLVQGLEFRPAKVSFMQGLQRL